MKRKKDMGVFFAGIFLLALGAALSAKAGIGTTPMAVLPVVGSMISDFSVGQLSAALNLVFVLVQWLILRSRFTKSMLIQIPLSFIFGFFIDFWLFLLFWLNPTNYIFQWFICLLSIAVGAFGIYLEIGANCWTLSGDGLVHILSKELKKDFGKVKISFDIFLVSIAIVLSLWNFGRLEGVREGTLVAALFFGACVNFYKRKLCFFGEF